MSVKPTRCTDVWLLLLHEGGHWSAPEIAENLGMDKRRVSNLVSVMRSRGYLAHFGRAQYSVTAACLVPLNITIRQIQEAGGA